MTELGAARGLLRAARRGLLPRIEEAQRGLSRLWTAGEKEMANEGAKAS